MTIAWDSTGTFIVGPGPGPTSSSDGTSAMRASLIDIIFTEATDYGSGPQMTTRVSGSVGAVAFDGDQTQAILDLLAAPPTP